eukprot:g660.t1
MVRKRRFSKKKKSPKKSVSATKAPSSSASYSFPPLPPSLLDGHEPPPIPFDLSTSTKHVKIILDDGSAPDYMQPICRKKRSEKHCMKTLRHHLLQRHRNTVPIIKERLEAEQGWEEKMRVTNLIERKRINLLQRFRVKLRHAGTSASHFWTLADPARRNSISVKGFARACYASNINLPEKEWFRSFRAFDITGDNCLSYEEFMKLAESDVTEQDLWLPMYVEPRTQLMDKLPEEKEEEEDDESSTPGLAAKKLHDISLRRKSMRNGVYSPRIHKMVTTLAEIESKEEDGRFDAVLSPQVKRRMMRHLRILHQSAGAKEHVYRSLERERGHTFTYDKDGYYENSPLSIQGTMDLASFEKGIATLGILAHPEEIVAMFRLFRHSLGKELFTWTRFRRSLMSASFLKGLGFSFSMRMGHPDEDDLESLFTKASQLTPSAQSLLGKLSLGNRAGRGGHLLSVLARDRDEIVTFSRFLTALRASGIRSTTLDEDAAAIFMILDDRKQRSVHILHLRNLLTLFGKLELNYQPQERGLKDDSGTNDGMQGLTISGIGISANKSGELVPRNSNSNEQKYKTKKNSFFRLYRNKDGKNDDDEIDDELINSRSVSPSQESFTSLTRSVTPRARSPDALSLERGRSFRSAHHSLYLKDDLNISEEAKEMEKMHVESLTEQRRRYSLLGVLRSEMKKKVKSSSDLIRSLPKQKSAWHFDNFQKALLSLGIRLKGKMEDELFFFSLLDVDGDGFVKENELRLLLAPKFQPEHVKVKGVKKDASNMQKVLNNLKQRREDFQSGKLSSKTYYDHENPERTRLHGKQKERIYALRLLLFRKKNNIALLYKALGNSKKSQKLKSKGKFFTAVKSIKIAATDQELSILYDYFYNHPSRRRNKKSNDENIDECCDWDEMEELLMSEFGTPKTRKRTHRKLMQERFRISSSQAKRAQMANKETKGIFTSALENYNLLTIKEGETMNIKHPNTEVVQVLDSSKKDLYVNTSNYHGGSILQLDDTKRKKVKTYLTLTKSRLNHMRENGVVLK